MSMSEKIATAANVFAIGIGIVAGLTVASSICINTRTRHVYTTDCLGSIVKRFQCQKTSRWPSANKFTSFTCAVVVVVPQPAEEGKKAAESQTLVVNLMPFFAAGMGSNIGTLHAHKVRQALQAYIEYCLNTPAAYYSPQQHTTLLKSANATKFNVEIKNFSVIATVVQSPVTAAPEKKHEEMIRDYAKANAHPCGKQLLVGELNGGQPWLAVVRVGHDASKRSAWRVKAELTWWEHIFHLTSSFGSVKN